VTPSLAAASFPIRSETKVSLAQFENAEFHLLHSCPIGIWVTDAQGRTRFVNRTYREFCGLTCEQVEADEWQSLLHPEEASVFVKAFHRALHEHTFFKAEQRSRRADGEWMWVESYAEPRFLPSGEFLGLVGTSKDITERKRVEQALQGSEERFRQLAENIREVFRMMPPAGDEILYVSPAYEEV
jgi:PAS domain S-box-containing protein